MKIPPADPPVNIKNLEGESIRLRIRVADLERKLARLEQRVSDLEV